MEVGSTSDQVLRLSTLPYPQDRILRRLTQCGVPKEQLDQLLQLGLVAFVKENKPKLPNIVYAILPTNDDIVEDSVKAKPKLGGFSSGPDLKDQFHESIIWLKWLMFEGEPRACLKNLVNRSVGQCGVCGDEWGQNDIVYRCKTCEHYSSKICVSCFDNGNHKDHEYSLAYMNSECCDCGDQTSSKRVGLCSKYNEAKKIKPLPEEIIDFSMGPVLDVLFAYWQNKLLCGPASYQLYEDPMKVENELTSAVVEMLLEICKDSKSLLCFVSRRMLLLVHLLDVLVRAERFLNKAVTKRLHELLLKLLGAPVFKYEFAKVFMLYYRGTIKEAIEECSDAVLEKYCLVSAFSLKIFTMPTLTLRLVKEMDLLGLLFGCLEDMFRYFSGVERHLKVSKWASLYKTTTRLVEDTRQVLSLVEVARYVIHEQCDIFKTWLKLLAFVHGMEPQKRARGVKIQSASMHIPFVLGNFIADIHTIFVNQAFSVEVVKDLSSSKDFVVGDSPPQLEMRSQKSYVCWTAGRSTTSGGTSQVADEIIDNGTGVSVPYTVTWLTCECLRAVENCLGFDTALMDPLNSLSRDISSRPDSLGLFSLSNWPDIVYDVHLEEISVHIPFHRLLSLLLHKTLKQCYGETGSLEMRSLCSASPPLSRHCHDFFGQVLRGCHPFGFSVFVMEHPLRIKVFCAEVQAGMWGEWWWPANVARLSCKWYLSVRRSEQGLDLDIFLLQCCAALAPPDIFVKRILERFGLSHYLSLNLKWSNKYEAVLVQEMLTLIIQIVSERRFCGLSTAESLRRELVYNLAIGDATHSKLVTSLPRDLSKNDQLQMILDSVADYSNPSQMKQGEYSLRETCWKELDLYHPNWNSDDLEKAKKRYLQFCKVSATAEQLPRWTNAFYPLHGISIIATSKALLEIVRAVLFYAVSMEKQSQSRAPDGVVIVVLHLLSLSLEICSLQRQTNDQSITDKSLEDVPIPLLVFAIEEISVGDTKGSDAGKHKSLLSLLVSLLKMEQKKTFESGHCNLSSLIVNLLKKFTELSVGCLIELQRLAPEVVMENEMGFDLDTITTGKTIPLRKSDQHNDDGSSSEGTPEDAEDECEKELSEGIEVDGNNSIMNKDSILIKVGDKFASAKECRDAIIKASILSNNVVKFEKSARKRIVAKCSSEGCKWRIYARAERDSDSVIVKTLLDNHTCLRMNVSTNKLAASIWVSDHIMDLIMEHPEYEPKQIQTFIESKFQINIEYMTAWRAKERALKKVYGSWAESYKKLPDYKDRVLQLNPGSIVILNIAEDKTFHRFFISYKACLDGFLNGCPPLMFINRTCIKQGSGGTILATIGVDGNNGMFPIAFALVEIESRNAWEWFFHQFRYLVIQHPGYNRMTIVSDHLCGLTEVINNLFPKAIHGHCTWDLAQKMRKEFGRKIVRSYFWPIAKAYTSEEYEHIFERLRLLNPTAANWIENNHPENWAASKFQGDTYRKMTINMTEMFIKWIVSARHLPVVPMLEKIRVSLMDLFHQRRTEAFNSSSCFTRQAEKLIEEAAKTSTSYFVHPASESIYEVRDNKLNGFRIDLVDKTCTCLGWQNTGIPCSHAHAAIEKFSGRPYLEYCNAYHSTQAYRRAYENVIEPVLPNNHKGFIIKEDVLPPIKRRKTEATTTTTEKRIRHCSICGDSAHTKQTCGSRVSREE